MLFQQARLRLESETCGPQPGFSKPKGEAMTTRRRLSGDLKPCRSLLSRKPSPEDGSLRLWLGNTLEGISFAFGVPRWVLFTPSSCLVQLRGQPHCKNATSENAVFGLFSPAVVSSWALAVFASLSLCLSDLQY